MRAKFSTKATTENPANSQNVPAWPMPSVIVRKNCDTSHALPQFAAVAVRPLDHAVVDDDPAADPGAEGEQHQTVEVAAGPDPVLAERRRVGVVLEGGRLAEGLVDVVADRDVPPSPEVAHDERAVFLAEGRVRFGIVPVEDAQLETTKASGDRRFRQLLERRR